MGSKAAFELGRGEEGGCISEFTLTILNKAKTFYSGSKQFPKTAWKPKARPALGKMGAHQSLGALCRKDGGVCAALPPLSCPVLLRPVVWQACRTPEGPTASVPHPHLSPATLGPHSSAAMPGPALSLLVPAHQAPSDAQGLCSRRFFCLEVSSPDSLLAPSLSSFNTCLNFTVSVRPTLQPLPLPVFLIPLILF